MGPKIKPRFQGFRLKWTFIRLILFISLMMVYSVSPIVGIILLVIVIGYLLFWELDLFRIERNNQIAREVIEAYPNASADQLRSIYQTHSCRQMRQDALLYLFLALYEALWSLLLYRVGLYPEWFKYAGVILTAVLLAVAMVLLILSLLPGTGKKPVPYLEDYIQNRTGQQALTERLSRQDFRHSGKAFGEIVTEGEATLERMVDSLKGLTESLGLRVFMVGLRILIDVVVLLWIILCLSQGGSYLIAALVVLSFFILARVFISCIKKNGNAITRFPVSNKAMRKLKTSGVLIKDRVLSAIPSLTDATSLEICFEKTGTVNCSLGTEAYQNLRNTSGQEALLLRDEKRVYLVDILKDPGAKEAEPVEAFDVEDVSHTTDALGVAEAPPLAAIPQPTGIADRITEDKILRMVEEGKLPTNEQLHEAGYDHLNRIDPAIKKRWKSEIDESYELFKSGKYIHGTTAEKGRSSMLTSTFLQYKSGPDPYRDMIMMDRQLTEDQKISREEIVATKDLRVPFKAYLPIIIAVLMIVIAIPTVALIERETGADLAWISVVVSSISGIVAMSVASALLNSARSKKAFKKMKKVYQDPEFWKAKIKIEAFGIFETETWNANKARDGK